jgi:hypothetical protein
LPADFNFLPPLGNESPFTVAAKKNQYLTKFSFDGSSSFSSWASQVRDGIWRVPSQLVSFARKYEHLKNDCLSGQARKEFTGGLEFTSNYESEFVNGMERLQIKYGLTAATYNRIVRELEETEFPMRDMELFKRNLSKMQSFEEQMIAAAPGKSMQDIAYCVYDHMATHVPHHIWSEVASEIRMNCAHLLDTDDFSALIGLAISKIRQIISRESFMRRYSKSDRGKASENGKKVEKDQRRKGSETTERSRQAKAREESEDEGNMRSFYEEESNSESSEEEDNATVCKFTDRRGPKSSGEKKEFKLLAPIGYFLNKASGEKEKIVDFEKIKSTPCYFGCGKEHGVMDCHLSLGERIVIMEKREICTKCLKDGHLVFECSAPKEFVAFCQVCKRRGHWDILCWPSLNKKVAEERKRKSKGGEAAQESKSKQLKSDLLALEIEAEASCKYRGRDGEP